MITDIWVVTADDAPVRRLLVDIIVNYQWGSVWNDMDGEAQSLLECLRKIPIDFVARVVIRLLENNTLRREPTFNIGDYI
jgi:hypothetical protein